MPTWALAVFKCSEKTTTGRWQPTKTWFGLRPGQVQVYLALGTLYLQRGRLRNRPCLTWRRGKNPRTPHNADIYVSIGNIYHVQDNPEAAETNFKNGG